MAKVLLKKSSVGGNAPTSLDYGEVALNYADGKLYYKNSSNTIKNFVDSAGTVTAARNSISVTDNGGDGSLSYSPSTGVITYTGPSATEVRSHFSAGAGIDITDGVISVDSAGLSTYYSKVINHDSTNGFVADEHIAHSGVTITAGDGLTGGGTIEASRTLNVGAGTGVTVTADAVSIGQDVATTADVTFHNITNNGWLDLKHDSASHPPHSEGRLFYSSEYKALTYHNDLSDVSLQVGLENWIRVYNNTGSTIANGTPVYITGATGETPTVAPADATTEAKAAVVGIATHDILNNSTGVATNFGLVSGIDTSSLTAGQAIHLGASGGLVTNVPTYPYYPTELGICVVSDSSDGYILVQIRHHTFERFRVLYNQFIGGDLTVNGNLTVNGTQSIVNQANLAVDTAFIYSNSGNTIGTSGTTFTGSGLNDAIFTGHYNGTTTNKHYYVRIDGVGTGTGGVDTFEWSLDNFSTTEATGVDITSAAILLDNGIYIDFNATTGHTLNDKWDGTASPVNVDAGFASNRNTGTSGVGYTHMGMFFDVTDEKWKLFKSYGPEPEGSINTGDSSYEKATLDANLTGNVTGNLTGNVTGNASTATTLASSRNFSASGDATASSVSFNGSANVNLALTLATVNSNVGSFGSSSVVPTITVNGKGLITAVTATNIDHDVLTNFVANEHIDHSSVTLTAGNGLTGGGDITTNRSFAVGAGVGIKVSDDAVSIDSEEVVYYKTPIRALFSAGGDLTYDSNGQFSFSETYSTASELLTAIKTVDGATSGLDADLLDGQHGSYYRIDVYDASGTLLN